MEAPGLSEAEVGGVAQLAANAIKYYGEPFGARQLEQSQIVI